MKAMKSCRYFRHFRDGSGQLAGFTLPDLGLQRKIRSKL